jgi:hypothetical protein
LRVEWHVNGKKRLIQLAFMKLFRPVEQCRISNKTFVEVQRKPLDCRDDLREKKRAFAVAEGHDLKYA